MLGKSKGKPPSRPRTSHGHCSALNWILQKPLQLVVTRKQKPADFDESLEIQRHDKLKHIGHSDPLLESLFYLVCRVELLA